MELRGHGVITISAHIANNNIHTWHRTCGRRGHRSRGPCRPRWRQIWSDSLCTGAEAGILSCCNNKRNNQWLVIVHLHALGQDELARAAGAGAVLPVAGEDGGALRHQRLLHLLGARLHQLADVLLGQEVHDRVQVTVSGSKTGPTFYYNDMILLLWALNPYAIFIISVNSKW